MHGLHKNSITANIEIPRIKLDKEESIWLNSISFWITFDIDARLT